MKLTAIFLLAAFLHVSATTIGQTVTIRVKDAPLKEIFREIQKQTGLDVFVDEALLQKTGKVTIDVKDMPVADVLNTCLHNEPLNYVISDGRILIRSRPNPTTRVADSLSAGPPGEFHGRVTNVNGEPLSGANVVIRRTRTGTITNAKGEFALGNLKSEDILIVSFVGYASQSIQIKGRNNLEIILELAKNELDKVVVQAYGTTTQRLSTGNIATVTAEEIAKQPVVNSLLALQGRVAGLTVDQVNGFASAPLKVELRGRSVIGDVPSDPLYIIDGVPLTILEMGGSHYDKGSTGFVQNPYMLGPAGGQSPFFSINPADIESITVLKDADATAIYGSRGANGVIIITTKTGSVGKTKLEFSVYRGMSEVTRQYKFLNTQQYLEMRHEAFANDGYPPDLGSAYDLLVWDTTRYTDWQKYSWGNIGKATDVQLSLSGGNKQTNFRLGFGYHHQTDITTASGASQRGSVQFNINHRSLDQKLTISFANDFSVAQTNMIDVSNMVATPPNAPPPFDSLGNLNYAGWEPAAYMFPFAPLLQPYNSTTFFVNSRINLTYQIIRGLSIGSSFGYSNSLVKQNSKTPISAQNPSNNPVGESQFGYNNGINWIIEPQLKYNCFIGRGKLEAMIGVSSQATSFDGNFISGTGYANDNLLGSISNAQAKDAYDNYGDYKYAAFFGRLNYNWENKYILNLSARRDGSSRFGPGKQYGNFGAIGGAWIFSEERFFRDHASFLSLGKIRVSYGSTGNDQIGDYKYLTRWSATSIVPYQGNVSYTPRQHANPDYQWQVNKKLELALALGLLKDRINIEIAGYRFRCGNQLVQYPLPLLTGFPSVAANSPANVENKGIEVTLNSKLIEKEKIDWGFTFNIGVNRNKLLAFPNILQSSYANILYVGQSLNLAHTLQFTGVDINSGLYTYKDLNKDGSITTSYGPTGDLYTFDISPKYSGGFGSNFRYVNWQVSVFFEFVKKIGTNAYAILQPPGGAYNEPVEVLNRWQKPGDKAEFARFSTIPDITDYYLSNSDAAFTDASFIRLSNLFLSYSVPEKILKKIRLEQCKIFIQGQNILTITKYKGVDPETANFGVMPPSRILTAGIEIHL